MENHFECMVLAGQMGVFGVVMDVMQKHSGAGERLSASVISVNSSRFGSDEAISIRLKSGHREGEIGKVLVRPLHGNLHLLMVPGNRTGGAEPELDSDGARFAVVLQSLLGRLEKQGLRVPNSPPPEKEPAGFRRPT